MNTNELYQREELWLNGIKLELAEPKYDKQMETHGKAIRNKVNPTKPIVVDSPNCTESNWNQTEFNEPTTSWTKSELKSE